MHVQQYGGEGGGHMKKNEQGSDGINVGVRAL